VPPPFDGSTTGDKKNKCASQARLHKCAGLRECRLATPVFGDPSTTPCTAYRRTLKSQNRCPLRKVPACPLSEKCLPFVPYCLIENPRKPASSLRKVPASPSPAYAGRECRFRSREHSNRDGDAERTAFASTNGLRTGLLLATLATLAANVHARKFHVETM